MLSHEENLSLREKKVLVVGCGGLGGHIIEQLARLGVGHITAVDADKFDETNLNRQLFSHSKNIGESKAFAAKKHVAIINPDIKLDAFQVFLDESNAGEITKGFDVICDALDSVVSRFILQKYAAINHTPMVHGAIAGWYGQVTTIFPNDNTLNYIYHTNQNKGIEQELGNPSFTPALVASIEVSEVLKILTGKGRLLRKRVLIINTLEQEYEILELGAYPTKDCIL